MPPFLPVSIEFTNREPNHEDSYVRSFLFAKTPAAILELAERCLGHKNHSELLTTYRDISVYICTMGPRNETMPLPRACQECTRGVQMVLWLGRDAGANLIWLDGIQPVTKTENIENGAVYIGNTHTHVVFMLCVFPAVRHLNRNDV